MGDLARDRLRELLEAVLDDGHATLGEMAAGAYTSPFHFSRQLARGAGESPVALRRRVLLERAAWRLQRGAGVTEVAFEAGYDSVEGFARAFARGYGHPPSRTPTAGERGHWLPAPNGVHFHSPTVLYVDAGGAAVEADAGDVTGLMVRHDLDDVRALLEAACGLEESAYRAVRLPGSAPVHFEGPDESLAQVLRHLVLGKAPWLATLEGADAPTPDDLAADDPRALLAAHDDLAPRWLAWVRETDRRRGWGDRVIDAICDPPESFLLGQVLAHVLTFSAHRRQLARWMLRGAGVDLDHERHPHLDPDPIIWHRIRTGGDP